MSSFSDYFERKKNNEIQFESDSFYPFLETAIILLIIYFSYKLFSAIKSPDTKYQDSEKYLNCQCDICKKRLKKIMKKNHKNKHYRLYIIILLFLFYFAKKYYVIILQNQLNIKTFDPYEILEISPFSGKKEIKKAYKRLALLYHPDKNKDDINAKNKFMLINKAYETLNDDVAKKNFELYGNPDGRSPMRISLGMPSFILNKKNHVYILIFFITFICLIIPIYFLKWYNSISKFEDNGILNITKEYFKKATNINTIILDLPFILGNAEDFNLIKEPHIKSEITQINNLYDKYKNIFKNKDILEKIGYRLSLNKKKAIGIAYEYSFCDRTDKNYVKLHKLNDYIILLSKLLNFFIDCQKEKFFQLKMYQKFKDIKTENQDKIAILKKLSDLQPVKSEYIFTAIIYQQCFYQGIPIYLIKDKFIPYTQLPHISLNNYKNIKNKNTDITFEKFLGYGDEDKKAFIKNIFNFNNTEIKDIIESTKSIPQYECKIKSYVEGFENTGFLKGDKVTFKLNITRKNKEDKKMGVQHSKCYPELFSEFLYIFVSNNNNLIRLDKIFIDKKESEYEFKITIGTIGILPIQIMVIPATIFHPNIVINCELKCFEKSEKREEMIKIIEDKSKKEKIEPSFIKKLF